MKLQVKNILNLDIKFNCKEKSGNNLFIDGITSLVNQKVHKRLKEW